MKCKKCGNEIDDDQETDGYCVSCHYDKINETFILDDLPPGYDEDEQYDHGDHDEDIMD